MPTWRVHSDGGNIPLHIELRHIEGHSLGIRFKHPDIAEDVCRLLNEAEDRMRQEDTQADADTGEWPPLGKMLSQEQP